MLSDAGQASSATPQAKQATLNTNIATTIQRMLSSGDPTAVAAGQQLQQQYGATQAAAGGSQPTSLLDQAKNAFSHIGNDAVNFLEPFNRIGQGIAHGLNAFSGGAILQDPLGTIGNAAQQGLQGLTGVDFGGTDSYTDPMSYVHSLQNLSPVPMNRAVDVDNFNLRQTLNQDPNAGGYLAGAFDTLGQGLMDPTSYVTGGTSKVAETGLTHLGTFLAERAGENGIAKAAAGDGIAQTLQSVMQQGLKKGLGSDEAVNDFRNYLQKTPEALDSAAGPEAYANSIIGGATPGKILGDIGPTTPGALEDGLGVKLAGKTILPYSGQLAPIARTLSLTPSISEAGDVGRSGMLNAIASSAPGQALGAAIAPVVDPVRNALGNALIPGSALARVFGKVPGNEMSQAIRTADEGAMSQAGDVANQLSALVKHSAANEQDVADITHAIQTHQPEDLAARYDAAGEAGKAALVRGLAGIRGQIGAGATLPFELTKAGTAAVEKHAEQIAGALGVTKGHLQQSIADKTLPVMINPAKRPLDLEHLLTTPGSLRDVEQKVQELGLLKPGQQFANHDAVNLTAKQAESHFSDKARDALLEDFVKQTDKQGNEAVTADAQRAAKLGYAGTALSDGSKVYLHPELQRAINDTATVINKDRTVESFDKAMAKFYRLWKGYAIAHVGFHVQNEYGNLFNNAIAGLRDPAYYVKAFKLQKAMAAAMKSTKPFEEAIREQGLTDRQVKVILAAKKEGVVGSSFFNVDQAVRKPLKNRNGTFDQIKGALGQFNPLNENNPVLKANRTAGSVVEGNARLAHFLWQYDKTGSAKAAAESTKKYLFDYSELTPFEQNKIKAVLPFYTYMRKNTPLQLRLLMEHPGFYANYMRVQNEALNDAPDNGTQYDANRLAQGAIPVQLPFMSSPALVQVASPLFQSFQQLQPLAQAASMIPGSPTHGQVDNARQGLAQNLLQGVGGPLASIAKDVASEAAGANVNTGSKIKPNTGALNLASALFPPTTYAQSAVNAANTGGDQAGAVALRQLAGLPVYAGGAQATSGELARRAGIVQNALAAAGGASLPTVAALRKTGAMPRRKGSTARRGHGRVAAHKSHHRKI